jgi:hypothetical protein
MNSRPYYDNGTLLMIEDQNYSSPIAVVHLEYYEKNEDLKARFERDKDLIQCIVTTDRYFHNSINPGHTQQPQLWDYADGVDTLSFLFNVSNGK